MFDMENFHALFVDDDKGFLDSIKTIFDIEGIKVYCVESGEDALNAIKEKNFNIMITDLTMNGMSGLDLARKAKELLPGLLIVLLTGNFISSEFSALAVKMGVSKIFAKPVNLNAILDMVCGEREIINAYRQS